MKNSIKHALGGMGLALAAAVLPMQAYGQVGDWPNKPITMVVPFPAGGATDIVGRIVAKQLSDSLGRPVVVENRGGANATIGMQYVANAKADGYTILYNTSSLSLSPALYKGLSFDPATSFDPVSTTAAVPMVLMVNNDLPVKTVQEFVQYAKKQQGRLNYASSGNGNVTHLAGFLFNKGVGITAEHVPYKGTAPALVDLVGGQTHYMIGTLNDALPLIKAGRVKALAVTTPARVGILPDLPTVNETVIKDFDLSAWQGVMTPAGVPPAILDKLNAAVLAALKSDDMKKQEAEEGTVILGSSREDYRKFIRAQIDYWQAAVREAGVKQG
jgi:tripartite-type tricarboxylate transporter receptor subunit TctC